MALDESPRAAHSRPSANGSVATLAAAHPCVQSKVAPTQSELSVLTSSNRDGVLRLYVSGGFLLAQIDLKKAVFPPDM